MTGWIFNNLFGFDGSCSKISYLSLKCRCSFISSQRSLAIIFATLLTLVSAAQYVLDRGRRSVVM